MEIDLVPQIGLLVQKTHILQNVLSLSFSLEEDLNVWEWLSLVSNLVDYAVEGSQIFTIGDISEHILLSKVFLHMAEFIDLEYLKQEEWVYESAHPHINVECVVEEVDLIGPNRPSL